ncbi:NACHT domain-containing protein [Actinomadura luteofluorescens]|uniref:NACHT domain-containing protein n=1 Tax=Actinomadura luteofluorescens TaxID=46163 RepID=UPI0030D12C79
MTDPMSKLLPYGLGWFAFLAVFLLLAKTYLSELMKALATRTPDLFGRLTSRRHLTGKQLRRYRKKVEQWYDRHPLGFEVGVVDIRALYIPLQYEEDNRRKDVYERMNQAVRMVLLGGPGAGKSLFLKHVLLQWVNANRNDRVPVLVELHQCNSFAGNLRDLIAAEFEKGALKKSGLFVDRALHAGKLEIFFDGLDEVGRDEQARVVKELNDFARMYSECKIVVTCRTTAYYGQLDADYEQVLRIAQFDDASIQRFLKKWPEIGGSEGVNRVFSALRSNPELMGLARNPLVLTIISYLQSGDRVDVVGPLPTSRAQFFQVTVTHLLDRDRLLGRKFVSGNYPIGRKLLVLEKIALALQENSTAHGDRLEIDSDKVLELVETLLPGFDLGSEHASRLLEEIVNRSQLLVALNRAQSRFAFAHLVLQEYLAAHALSGSPEILLRNYRADPESWRETVKIWCAVAQMDCTGVISEVFHSTDLRQQVLALECLADTIHVSSEVAQEIIDFFISRVNNQGLEGQAIVAGLGAVASSSGPRGSDVRSQLISHAQRLRPPARQPLLQALSASGQPEAANFLAELASEGDVSQDARSALQEMGEIAVPVLAESAARGEVWAVDALHEVGTPSTAEELAKLLFRPDWLDPRKAIAVRAAWKLAALLRKPDIEEVLRNLDPSVIPAEKTEFEWIWAPFSSSRDATTVLAGRIATLIDDWSGERFQGWFFAENHATPAESTDLIDARIGISVACFGIDVFRSPRSLFDTFVDPEDIRELTGQLRSSFNIPGTILATKRVLLSRAAAMADGNPTLIQLREAILRYQQIPGQYRQVIRTLEWPVQAQLLGHFLVEGRERINRNDWRKVNDTPHRPLFLARTFAASVFALFVIVVGVSALNALGNIFGFGVLDIHSWGPRWTSWSIFAGAFLVGASVFVGYKSENHSKTIIGDISWACFVLISLYLILASLVCAMGLLAEASSWSASFAVLMAVGLLLVVNSWVLNRRNRAYKNPLRKCLHAANSVNSSSFG